QHLRRVIWLAQSSPTGDRAELPDVPDDSAVWPWVTSTRDNCLGADCADFGTCFVVKARRRALAADVVVINHHLFFADLMLRDTGGGELLPVADAVVFDEAHQLLDIGLHFAGVQVSTQQWVELARDTQAAGLTLARGLADWAGLAASLHQAVREARLAAGHRMGRFGWDAVPHEAGAGALAQLRPPLDALDRALDAFTELAPDFARLKARTQELQRAMAQLGEADAFPLRMIEVTPHAARWRVSPLNLHDTLGAFVAQSEAAFVFTSATLATRGDFSFLRDALGVSPQHSAALASPFDFAQQGRLYVPQRFPLPRDEGFDDAVAAEAAQLVRASAGGALLLCTSLRSMRSLGERLTQLLGAEVPVILQDQTSRREAVQRMREQRSLLVGSQSFWEGLDLPGDLLTLVMIDKLPFAPPDDPLAKARNDEAERAGKSGFSAVSLPQAAMALKQGAGRLIRTVDDRGVLAVFDRRLTTTGYGRTLLMALPPFTRVAHLAEACAFLADDAPVATS
ncbi:MAG: ATP-dependent DNA helicase, partial [Betaproteobacteria bacterium]|nr:ATP-dependent DNA helicase [Betaproteobacteria bacterium]